MTYKQLTQEQRYQIYAMKKVVFRQKQIALEISVHPSTVSRELERNHGQRRYRPKQAHQKAEERKSAKAKTAFRRILGAWLKLIFLSSNGRTNKSAVF
jgi:transposase, IS30 family